MTTTPPIARPGAYWSERFVRAMGSEAHIIVGDAPEGVIDWAATELERLEQCWSRFRPDSELVRLNEHAGAWTDASASMLLALTCAVDLHEITGGRFDPTILDALERAGYDRTFAAVTLNSPIPGPRPTGRAPGLVGLDIDADTGRVRLPRGTRLDLGGIGKGLAADLVARGLVDRGARTALVGMGGDLRARGEVPPDGAWVVPVLDPFDDSRVAFTHLLTDGAIVTSTTRIRAWTRAGRRYHHLIDPATSDPADTGVVAVVAAAGDAWWAEGIAKAMLIAGPAAGPELAQCARVHAWMFHDDGRITECGTTPC